VTIKEHGYQQRVKALASLGLHLERYDGHRTMMLVRCSNHHIFELRPKVLKKKPWCPVCRKTEEEATLQRKIESAMQNNNLSVIKIEKRATQTFVKFGCSSGHVSSRAIPLFLADHRCHICSKNSGLSTHEIVTEDLARRGFSLVPGQTITSLKQKLAVLCPKGHKIETTHTVFMRTKSGGCKHPYCDATKPNLNRVKESFVVQGYELLTEYRGAHAKMEVKCDKGHIFHTKWNRWSNGHLCPTCFATKKYTVDEIHAVYETAGYTVLNGTYNGHHSKMKALCPNKHEYTMSFKSFLNGRRCPRCQTNRPEDFLFDWLKQLGVEFLHRDRTTLSGIELDFFLPRQRLAVEYCGLYWHSTEYLPADYHIKKLDICRRDNIRLITLFEDEFLFDRGAVLQKILDRIGGMQHSPPSLLLDRRWDHEDDWVQHGYQLKHLLPPKKWHCRQQRRYGEKPSQFSVEIFDCGYAEIV